MSSDVDVAKCQVYQALSILHILYILTLFPCLSTRALNLKVISTDAGASLPDKDGRAELLNSSLVKYSQVTLCARFLTYHFSTHSDSGPEQILLSSGDDVLLSSYITRPCELKFQVNLWELSHFSF